MAMTKKEKVKFDSALAEIRILGALRWTSKVEPDTPPPEGISEITKGWLFNVYVRHVESACSSCVHHGYGQGSLARIGGGARSLYSTKLLALKALRHEAEREYAKYLADIDEQIANETQKPTPLP
jgi:hypothetical protein